VNSIEAPRITNELCLPPWQPRSNCRIIYDHRKNSGTEMRPLLLQTRTRPTETAHRDAASGMFGIAAEQLAFERR
jgi:hypothetical protein